MLFTEGKSFEILVSGLKKTFSHSECNTLGLHDRLGIMIQEESELQVERLIARGNIEDKGRTIMKTLPIQPHEVPGFEGAIDENGWLRVLPGVLEGHLMSTDGFFVARLVRLE